MFLAKRTIVLVTIEICFLFETMECEHLIGSAIPPSAKELQALEQFKEMAKGIVYLDYQEKDSFLLCWIRASELNLGAAKLRLIKSMQWRKENKIDSLLENPEMKKMEKIFRFSVDTVDRHGHPILDFNTGRWDFRKVALSGKAKEFQLFWVYMYETVMKKSRELNDTSGKDMSEFLLLMDVGGFNVRMHGCLACLPIFGRILADFENNYAGFAHSFVLANSPRTVDVVLDFTRPLMSPATRNAITVLTTDRNQLKDFFTKLVDEEQLGRQYGGKRNPGYGR